MDLLVPTIDARFGRRHSASGGWYDYREDYLFIADSTSPNLPISRACTHEVIHFLEHCSTPYGHLKDQLERTRVKKCVEFLTEYTEEVYCPIFSWAQRLLHSSSHGHSPAHFNQVPSPDLIGRCLKPWSATVVLESCLDGEEHNSKYSETAMCDLVDYLESECLIPQSLAFVSKHAPPTGNATSSAIQTMTLCSEAGELKKLSIGAKHASESIAQILEQIEPTNPLNMGNDYLAFPLMTYACLVESGVPDNRLANAAGCTCLALADLALFSPLGSPYAGLRQPHMTWQDVHPGFRFQKAIQFILSSKKWITSVGDCESLANEVCDRFEWPRPRDFLELAASSEAICGQRHSEACRIRINEYSAFYSYQWDDPSSPVLKFYERHMPMVRWPGHGTVLGTPDDGVANNPLGQVTQSYISRIVRKLMLPRGSKSESVLPNEIDFPRYFNDVETVGDLIGAFERKNPWSRADRFLPISTELGSYKSSTDTTGLT
jgi:hypothetical protein